VRYRLSYAEVRAWLDLVQCKPQALSRPAHGSSSLVFERCVSVVIRQQPGNTSLGDRTGKMLQVLRTDLQKQRVHMTAQANGLGLGGFAFSEGSNRTV